MTLIPLMLTLISVVFRGSPRNYTTVCPSSPVIPATTVGTGGEDVYWIPNDTRPFAYRIDQGDYWAWNSCEYGWLKDGGKPETGTRGDKGRLWGLSWYGIRKANIGIANLDKLTDATQEEKTLSKVNSTFFVDGFILC